MAPAPTTRIQPPISPSRENCHGGRWQQQGVGSDRWISQRLQLDQSPPVPWPEPAMDFLAGFDFGSNTTQSSNVQLASIDDLKQHLRGILNAKVTATRTEHVAITVELRANVRLVLQLSQSESNALPGLPTVDPSLGGNSPNTDTEGVGQSDGSIFRAINVNESLLNQPRDNPVMQNAIAKHIVNALGATDESAWTAREVSRGTHGWTFVYMCKDSLQMWKRQTSKANSTLIIGEYSYKDADPILMSRPAFDCRGCITILFSRNTRSIVITYDHTPLHKTVGQLSEHYKPPAKELGPGAQKPKTPKKTAGSAKKDSARTQDGSARPRKRSKKKNGEIQPSDAQDSGAAASDGTNGAQANGTTTEQEQGAIARPQSQPPVLGMSSINVTPAEAARRRDAATAMLSDAGVDPNSLSTEQFNIFANQSPELQKESLNMLVKYGAERLRIVHPSNSETASSGAGSPSGVPTHASQTQATPSGPTTTKELVPQSQVVEEGGPVDSGNSLEQSRTSTTTKAKGGKSRLACFQCKQRKVKCPKEKPTCTECQETGLGCEYPPPKPRNKKKSLSEAVVVNDDDDDEDEDEEVVVEQQQTHQEQFEQTLPQHDQHPEPQHPQLPENDAPGTTNEPATDHAAYAPQAHSYVNTADVSATQRPIPELYPHQPSYFNSAGSTAAPHPGSHRTSYLPESNTSSVAPTRDHGYGIRESQNRVSSPALSQQATTDKPNKSKKGGRKLLVDSPHLRDGSAQLSNRLQAIPDPSTQAARSLHAMPGRITPDQSSSSSLRNAPPPRTGSRQSHGAQSRPHLVDDGAASVYQQPIQASDQQTQAMPGPTTHLGNTRTYNESSTSADNQSAQRITYVPYAHQQRSNPGNLEYSSSEPNHGVSSTLDTRAAATSHVKPVPVPQSRQAGQSTSLQGRSTRAQPGHAYYHTSNSTEPSTSSDTSSLWDYHMQAASTQASRLDQARVDRQQTQSPYESLPQAQPQPHSLAHQPAAQRHGWYDYNHNNNPASQQFSGANHQNRQYGWRAPDSSWPGDS
ncbi:Sterol regulatory element-binding protein [Paramyrothecium foliicola]|nr:Sterol regulatory element-binding protein [Paramyrothecium foliicola]